jgi:DNA-binding SARP family transcriptional activator/TolB-like protein/Tfp pilus assembly protein PilF
VFRLRTLGGAALDRDGVTLDTIGARRKTLALLALLAVSRGRGISRERVAAYLWPESDTERARGALKQALHVVRRELGSPEAILGTAELRLNPSYIESDVDAFLSALEEDELDHAVDLYGGPFLDGFHIPGSPEFEQWTSTQRDEFARRYASALERLAAAAEARGDSAAAIEWLRRLQTVDPLSARVTLRLMRALDAVGERIAALRCAQIHEALLEEELGNPPDPEVEALAERLRKESVRPKTFTEAAPLPEPTSSSSEDVTDFIPAHVEAYDPVLAETGRQAIRLSHMAVALVGIAVVLAVALIVAGQRGPRGASFGVTADRSVAVLPFENVSGDSANDHLSDGLTVELTSALSRVEGLRVVPRTATLALKRTGLDLRAIADTLGVASVVEGTVHREGNRLKVTAHLVNAHDRTALWSATFDREMHEFLAVQEEIAREIVGALYPQRTVNADPALVGRRTDDPEAYDLYLRGRHHWRQRTREALQQTVVFYEQAIERDPTFVVAYAGLADAYVNLSNFGYADVREALARAEVAADRALALDPELADGHAAKGFVLASKLDFPASEAAFRRAIELNPSHTWAHHYYTLLFLMLGRTDEALEHNRHALAADPLSLPANATRGIILLQRGDYPGADRELQRALTLSPSFQLTQYYLAVLRAAQGRDTDAGRLLEGAAPETPDFTGMPGARALVFQRTGRPQAADSLIAQVEARAREGDQRARVNLAFYHAVLGRLDAAFDLFDQVQWDVPSLIELRADPLLEPLRSDPRYPALLQKIGADR